MPHFNDAKKAAAELANEPEVTPTILECLIMAEDMLKQCMKQTEFTLGACKNMRRISDAIYLAKAKGTIL